MNLTIANRLCNAIAGASVCLYDASREAFDDRGDSTRRFKQVVECYFPDPVVRFDLIGHEGRLAARGRGGFGSRDDR